MEGVAWLAYWEMARRAFSLWLEPFGNPGEEDDDDIAATGRDKNLGTDKG